MFKQDKAKTLKEYFDKLPKERKETLLFLDKFIRRVAPSLKPYFANNMPGYGSFPYKNYKKEMIEWPIIALANQKNYVSIYVCAIDGDEYVAEKHKKDLGKAKVGKSCISFKNLEDINLKVLEDIIIFAGKKPGLTKNNKSA